VAGGFSLSALWIGKSLAGARPVGVFGVWVPDVGNCRNDIPGHANSFAGVVPGYVVGDDSEERGQCIGAATGAGAERVSNSMDDAA